MGKHAQIVMGPAGSGKSTYVNTMRAHCETLKRSVHCVNLDPAAEDVQYDMAIDLRDLVTVDDVMEELDYGPNGGLVCAMQFLIDNMEWFKDQLGDYEDDYLFIDCPGQIELYTHMDIIQRFVRVLQNEMGYGVCAVYLLDSNFITDSAKYVSGTLMCLSAMICLEIPHINIMSKMDLVAGYNPEHSDFEDLQRYVNPDLSSLTSDLDNITDHRFKELNHAITTLIDEYSMVSFLPLDITSEENVGDILAIVDNAMQYGEDLEVREPRDEEYDDPEDIDM
eukprot:TRINITY_DN14996_c0_g1_i1.p1 TRINITY_DN14996_c0_g1~~TRINITY_DN14996_c0_g1_i1.p1  ORF type:complete len:280 (+),score=59.30 TRINITY_DN14996_c0_g1_i1:80-919(+)